MFGRTGVAGLTCERDGMHTAHTDRLRVSTTRVSDLPSVASLIDEAASYRQGWDACSLPREAPPGDPVLWHATYMPFLARHRVTGEPVAHISLYLADGGYQVGGTVGPCHRGQGYGREALGLVCLVAHRHLGIADLTAGCEASNEPSRRWLVSCGFSPVDGPARHALPNGRVIDCLWWRRSGPAARRCRHLRPVEPLPAAAAPRQFAECPAQPPPRAP